MAFNLGELFAKGSIAEQLVVWDVLGQLATPLLGPMLQTIASGVWSVDPNVPTSPATLAELAARGLIGGDAAATEAAKSGVGSESFARMVAQVRRAPDLSQVVAAYHRGLIPADGAGADTPSLTGALVDAGVKPEWVGIVRELALNIPTAADYLNAYLQGQISEAESRAGWALNGMRPDDFGWMFDANGTAPTPDMAGTMANRGIIPWEGDGPSSVSFHQAFLEGPWRNKWAAPMRALMEYLPPARTVTAMVRAGSISDALALSLWEKEGLSPELAAAYLADAHHGKAAAAKELSQSQIVTLYRDHKIDAAKAKALLVGLRYTPENADLLLSLADVAKADTHVTAAITKVRTLFVGRRITAATAKQALADLHLPGAQITELIDLWSLEAGVNVRQLTPAQIVDAWAATVIDQATAESELQALGYTAWDAWVLLSIKGKGPLPNEPARSAGVGVLP